MNHKGEHAWAAWLVGTLGSFAVLETIAVASRGNSLPTLSNTLSRWLGANPPTRWGEVGPLLFGVGWLALTLHVARYPGDRIVLVSEADAVAAAEEITKEAAKWWKRRDS